MNHLQADQCVEPGHLKAAQDFSQQLLGGMRKTLDHANAAKQANESEVRKRLAGKQPVRKHVIQPVTPEESKRWRYTGKQTKRKPADLLETTTVPKNVFRGAKAAEAPY